MCVCVCGWVCVCVGRCDYPPALTHFIQHTLPTHFNGTDILYPQTSHTSIAPIYFTLPLHPSTLHPHTLPTQFSNILYPPTSPTLTHCTLILYPHTLITAPTYLTLPLHPSTLHPYTLPTNTHPLHPHTLPSHFTHILPLHQHTLPTHFTNFAHILYPPMCESECKKCGCDYW